MFILSINFKLNINTNIKFYEENDTCPSCKQDIDITHKENVFKEIPPNNYVDMTTFQNLICSLQRIVRTAR